MTADAKIGLLLGLMFIAIIAFLLNGLPDFLQEGSDGVIETAITPARNSVVMEETVFRVVEELEPVAMRQVDPPSQEQVVAVFTDNQPVLEIQRPTPVVFESPVTQAVQSIEAAPLPQTPAPSAAPVYTAPAAKGNLHVVQKGESLAAIAKKYYGSEVGNTRAVINRLYELNSDVLESVDKIKVGDKLTIPPVRELVSDAAPQQASPTQTLLSRFKGVFEPAGKPSAPSVKTPARAPAAKVYTVQTGDRLWDIAQEQLGDGKRYTEIVRLNKLTDPDHIPAGTKLKLPSR